MANISEFLLGCQPGYPVLLFTLASANLKTDCTIFTMFALADSTELRWLVVTTTALFSTNLTEAKLVEVSTNSGIESL